MAIDTDTNSSPVSLGIGRVIARLRAERGWSQRTLAELAEVDQSTVCRVESGAADDTPTAGTVRAILGALGVDMTVSIRLSPGDSREAPPQPAPGEHHGGLSGLPAGWREGGQD